MLFWEAVWVCQGAVGAMPSSQAAVPVSLEAGCYHMCHGTSSSWHLQASSDPQSSPGLFGAFLGHAHDARALRFLQLCAAAAPTLTSSWCGHCLGTAVCQPLAPPQRAFGLFASMEQAASASARESLLGAVCWLAKLLEGTGHRSSSAALGCAG